jgi:hypothetical protein
MANLIRNSDEPHAYARPGSPGCHQPDGAHRLPEINHNWIGLVRVKGDNIEIASIATADASQWEGSNAKQKTGFFRMRKAHDGHMFSALPPIAAGSESCQHLRFSANWRHTRRALGIRIARLAR